MSTQRTVVITGGTGGIGLQSALGIAKTGARVLVTGRNQERGEQAVQRLVEESGNGAVELVVADSDSWSAGLSFNFKLSSIFALRNI